MDWYSVSKSLHLIGMVSWMAGLFFLVRIMVYHAEVGQKPESERSTLARQYNFIEGRVYKVILMPAVVITWTFGTIMLVIQPIWMEQGWMHVKLLFLALLTGYTHYCKGHIRKLEIGAGAFTHLHYRALNEVPTIFMVAIIFLAVFKSRINFAMLFGGLFAFIALLAWGIRKANQVKKPNL
jgi:protoporphyrinogen IX oxidase